MDLFKNFSEFNSKNGPVSNNLSSVKIIGIYFSAHWCPPCRGFTPVLAGFYNKVNENEKVFEVVFVSSDSEEESYKNYLSEMPWVALPLNNYEGDQLKHKFQVKGIPRLVILSPNGEKIQDNGRESVTALGVQAFYSWTKSAANESTSKRKYEEGQVISVSSHEHPLKYVNYQGKSDPAYSKGFNCDVCGQNNAGEVFNFNCFTCNYDLCENCYKPENSSKVQEKIKSDSKISNSNSGKLFSNALHEHPLKYVTAEEKSNSAYLNGFNCDECKIFNDGTVKNYFCGICGYDLCDNCYRSNK
jgi:thiol-disulfide isomerase/thioredoxin